MKRYYVYLIQCFDGTYYAGITNNVERRFSEHQAGVDEGCYTFTRRPLKLVFVSEFQWVDEAIAFEKKVKGWSHRKKRALALGAWDDVRRFSRRKSLEAPPSTGSG